MTAALNSAVRFLKNRVAMMIGRCVLAAIDDTTMAQSLQVELLDGETADGVEHFNGYGHTSVPFPGAEAIMAAVGGLRSHGVVIALVDRRHRPTGLQAGESLLYDDLGQRVYLTRTGIVISSNLKITINSAAEVDVTTPKAVITAGEVDLGATGGKGVARIGDLVDLGTGKIIGGSTTVKAAG